MLLSTIAVLHPSLTANIAEEFFYTAYPRYRIPGRTSAVSEAISATWRSIAVSLVPRRFDSEIDDSCQVTSQSLNLDTQKLCSLSLPASTRTSAITGAFSLLTHLLSASPNLTPSHLYSTTSSSSISDLLSRMLPNLIAAFTVEGNSGTGTKVGEDEALFFVWWCVQDELKGGGEIEDGILFTLVEVSPSLDTD